MAGKPPRPPVDWEDEGSDDNKPTDTNTKADSNSDDGKGKAK